MADDLRVAVLVVQFRRQRQRGQTVLVALERDVGRLDTVCDLGQLGQGGSVLGGDFYWWWKVAIVAVGGLGRERLCPLLLLLLLLLLDSGW